MKIQNIVNGKIKYLRKEGTTAIWIEDINQASCLSEKQANDILYAEEEEAAMGGEACSVSILDEGYRPCNCGSGEPWASCWAESQYCG